MWLQLEGSVLLSVLGFPFALNMEAEKFSKKQRIPLSTNHPVHF